MVQVIAWHHPSDKPLYEPTLRFNSSSPSAAYMRQWTVSTLVQIMACRLFGAKPLPEPMLAYCQFDSWEHISVKYESEFYNFHSRKCNWKCRLPNWQPFCPGGDELMSSCGGVIRGLWESWIWYLIKTVPCWWLSKQLMLCIVHERVYYNL